MSLLCLGYFLVPYSLHSQTSASHPSREATGLRDAALEFEEKEDWSQASRTWSKLGKLYRDQLGQLDEAIEAFERVIVLQKAHTAEEKRDRNVAHFYNLLGGVFQRKGDYTQAISVYEEAIRLRTKVFGSQSVEVAQVLTNLGTAYRYQKDFTKALELYGEALSYRTGQTDRDWVKEGIIHNQLGEVYLEKRELDRAKVEFEMALRLFEEHAPDRLDYREVVAVNLGHVHTDMGDLEAASEWYSIALSLADSVYGSNGREAGKVRVAMGDLLVKKGHPKVALEEYQKALKAMLPNYTANDVYSNPSPELLSVDPWVYITLGGKGRAHRKMFERGNNIRDLEAAFEALEQACEFSDLRRAAYWSEGAKRELAEEIIPTVELSLEVANELYTLSGEPQFLERAFLISERSKAALILENLDREMAIPPSFLADIKALEMEMGEVRRMIFQEGRAGVELDSLESRLFSLGEQHGIKIARLKEEYMGFPPQVLEAKTIQQLLGDDRAALIEYFHGRENLFAFVLLKDEIEMLVLPIGPSFSGSISRLRNVLMAPPQGDPISELENYAGMAHEVYRAVFAPLEPLLDSSGIDHLTIVPDGPLWYIPFEALLTNPGIPENYSFRSLPWLQEKYAFHYAYSGTLLEKAKTESEEEGALLAIAPDFSNNSRLTRGVEPKSQAQPDFPPLTWSLPEIREISDHFVTDTLTGNAASEYNFKSRASRYAGIHFSTHAFLNDSAPMYSFIALQGGEVKQGAGGKPEDDSLFLYELYGMDLKAEMVVLSACETGAGELQQGEGLISLARGFAFNGCPTVVTSLWKADDQSTYEIMKGFYAGLADGKGKAKAMQEAKKEYLANSIGQFGHPYYWANFVVIGEEGPVTFQRPGSSAWWYWIIAGIILLGGGFLGWKKLKIAV